MAGLLHLVWPEHDVYSGRTAVPRQSHDPDSGSSNQHALHSIELENILQQVKRAELQPSSQSAALAAAELGTRSEQAAQPPVISPASCTHESLQADMPIPRTAVLDGPVPSLAASKLDSNSSCQQSPDAPAAAEKPQAQMREVEEGAECIICWEAPANVVLQPCGHMCACIGCIGLLSGLPCPMCRQEVTSSMAAELVL